MNILHYFDKTDSMTAQYIAMLSRVSSHETAMFFATDCQEALKILQMADINILHIHGCWRTSTARLFTKARTKAIRLVVSPHGQLEPWFFNQRYWKEKLPKALLFQHRIISQAYAIVVEGAMEEECLRKLNWNKRIIIVRNPIITCSITAEETLRQLTQIYRRIMDSNTIELMQSETLSTLRLAIKAGITQDIRWLNLPASHTPPHLDEEGWRQIRCYAQQEQIEQLIDRGLRILQCDCPHFDEMKSHPFFPDHYQPSKGIEETIGMSFTSENKRLIETFRLLHRLISRNKLTVCHLCELDKELREHDCNEEKLTESLEELRLLKSARRLMQVMVEETGFDEGFMPFPPLNDRVTRNIERQIKNHLKI